MPVVAQLACSPHYGVQLELQRAVGFHGETCKGTEHNEKSATSARDLLTLALQIVQQYLGIL